MKVLGYMFAAIGILFLYLSISAGIWTLAPMGVTLGLLGYVIAYNRHGQYQSEVFDARRSPRRWTAGGANWRLATKKAELMKRMDEQSLARTGRPAGPNPIQGLLLWLLLFVALFVIVMFLIVGSSHILVGALYPH